MKNTPNGSLSETSKLTDAILSADEHINGYLTMLQETYSGEIRQHCKWQNISALDASEYIWTLCSE